MISIRPEQAEQAVEDLSDIFRASLDDASIFISLEDEITLARQYLGIESLRFANRLKVTWALEDGLEHSGAELPRLCLQPLLENAVVHGIQPDPNGGEIIISIINAEELNLIVSNTLPSEEKKPSGHNQMALKNISDRLQALYDSKANLTTRTYETNGKSWYETRMTIPTSRNTEMAPSIRRAS